MLQRSKASSLFCNGRGLARKILKAVNRWLSDCGVMMRQGILVDATIIEALRSNKNKSNQRDPDIH